MKLCVKGHLAVAMSVVQGDTVLKCKEIELSDLSTGEMFNARSKAKENEFWALHELAAKTQLIDQDGNHHQMTYDMLRDTSSANFKKLEELDFELQLKLSAENLENPSN